MEWIIYIFLLLNWLIVIIVWNEGWFFGGWVGDVVSDDFWIIMLIEFYFMWIFLDNGFYYK